MNKPIVNKVANSSLKTIDLAKFLPEKALVGFDIKDYLFKELILREKDFRLAMAENEWSKYTDKNVAIYCSADAIIPQWSYMLIGSYIQNHASFYAFGKVDQVKERILIQNLGTMNVEEYKDQKVIIKGCGNDLITAAAYTEITRLLMPTVNSLMFGEACSTVPIFKKKKQ